MRTQYTPKGPQWEEMFGDKTTDILSICHDFAKDAALSAPFCIVLGESNAKLIRELLHKDSGLVVQEVGLCGSLKLFSMDPCLIVRSKDSGKIRHIMAFSYHGMWFLKTAKPQKETLVLHDHLWNAICQWSGVPVADECLFSRRDGAMHRDVTNEVIYQRHQEKVSGINTRHEEARAIMSRMLAKPQHIDLVANQATQATDEWKNSEAGKRQRAGREKGQATKTQKALQKWAIFYNHPEVQNLISPERQDALSQKHRELAAKIQAANVAEEDKQRTRLLSRFALFKNGNIVAVPPEFLQLSAEKKKQILAEMSETAETAETPETPVKP
ncbi:hypothetical protein ACHAPE_005385 [Trichoderma viride]